MKIWLKLCLGMLLGSLVGLYLPPESAGAAGVSFLARLFLQIGRYLVVPTIFFSFFMGVFELRLHKKLIFTLGKSILYGGALSVCLMVLGVTYIGIVSPSRLPILSTPPLSLQIPSLSELVLRIFPVNAFTIFIEGGDYLVPVLVLSFLLGVNLTFNRQAARPIVELFDSLSRLFWYMNLFLTEFLYIPLIFVSSSLVFTLRKVQDLRIYQSFLLHLTVLTVIISLIVFPVLFYLIHQKRKPFRWLVAQIGPGIAAFVSGDVLWAYGQLARHGHEMLGLSRKSGAVSKPIVLVFSRSGTALITLVSFLFVFRSYSSLELGLVQTLWVMFLALLISVSLWAAPGTGTLVAILLLSRLFGRGLEEGYLILSPVMPVLICLGAFLDILSASFVSYWVADKTNELRPEEECRNI